jgi:hypothetical protein
MKRGINFTPQSCCVSALTSFLCRGNTKTRVVISLLDVESLIVKETRYCCQREVL